MSAQPQCVVSEQLAVLCWACVPTAVEHCSARSPCTSSLCVSVCVGGGLAYGTILTGLSHKDRGAEGVGAGMKHRGPETNSPLSWLDLFSRCGSG